MPFGTPDLSHLSTPDQFALGPSSSFMDIFNSSRERAAQVDSAFGMQTSVKDSYLQQVERLKRQTGQDYGLDPLFALNLTDAGVRRAAGIKSFSALQAGQESKFLGDIDRIDAAITKGKETDPELKTFKEVFDEEVQNRAKLIQASESARARGRGLEAVVADLVGTMAGSIDPQRDPVYFYSLFFGGFGKSLAMRLLTEAGVGGAAEAAQQFGFVQPRAQALGEPAPDPFQSILVAALGAGVLRGGIELGPGAFRAARGAIEERFFPTRAAAREISDLVRGAPDFSRLTNQDLLNAVEALPRTSDNAVARAALTDDIITEQTSPLAGTREGLVETERQVARAAELFEDGRPMNPQSELFAAGPTEAQITRDLARTTAPEVAARMEVLETKVKDTEEALRIATDAQNEFRTGKAFDEEIARVRAQFDEQLAELERVRVESNASPNNKKIVAERQRIEKQAKAEIQKVGSVRFVTERMLREDIAKSRKTLRDTQRQLDKLRAPFVPEAKTRKAAAEVSAPVAPRIKTEDLDAIVGKEPDVPPEHTDELIEKMRASLKEVDKAEGVPVEGGKTGFTAAQLKGMTMEVMGKDVPLDLDVPGPAGSRKAVKVLEELEDEDALVKYTRECTLGGGEAT